MIQKIHTILAVVFISISASAQTDTLNFDNSLFAAKFFPTSFTMGSAGPVTITATGSDWENATGSFVTYPPNSNGSGAALSLYPTGGIGATGSYTITFARDITDVAFSIFDIDGSQGLTLTGQNSAGTAVTVTGQTLASLNNYSGSTASISNSGTTALNIAGATAGWTPNNNRSSSWAGVNIFVAGPVRSITIGITTGNINGDGTIFISDITATVPDVLPVSFGLVNASADDARLSVDWTTLSETNNSHFEIEASHDGKEFIKIGQVQSLTVSGNSDWLLNYRFTKDAASSGFLGLSIVILGLGLGWKYSKKQKMAQYFLATGILLMATAACNKSDLTNLDKKDNLFVRIAQVDKDASKSYSAVVRVVRK